MATPRKQPARKPAKRTARKTTGRGGGTGKGKRAECTPTMIETICGYIAEGMEDWAAALHAGIKPGTLTAWKAAADPEHERHHARYVSLVEALTHAERERVRKLQRDSVLAAAFPHPVEKRVERQHTVVDQQGHEHELTEVTVTTTEEWDWRAGLEALRRYDPENWRRKDALELTGAGGGALQVETKVVEPFTAEDAGLTVAALIEAGVIAADASPAEVAAALAGL